MKEYDKESIVKLAHRYRDEGADIYNNGIDAVDLAADFSDLIVETMPKYTRKFTVKGINQAQIDACLLISKSKWFIMEPQPDDCYTFTVKDE